MSEFGTIIGLQNERLVTEVSDCSPEEIYRGIAALLHVWINKTFSGSFINYCVLIKLLRDSAGITGSRDIFNIHLPFDSQLGRSVVRLRFSFW